MAGSRHGKETDPLVPRESTTTTSVGRRLARGAGSSVRRMAYAINAFAFLGAISHVFEAYPDKRSEARRIAFYGSIPIVMAAFAIDFAAKAQAENPRSRSKDVQEKFEYVSQGANLSYFFLGFSISVYIAIDAMINNIGENEVDVSDTGFALGFVAPSFMLGAAIMALQLTRERWETSEHRLAKAAKGLYIVASTLLSAATLNELVLFSLSWAKMSEGGKMNPYERLAIFSSALLAGVVTEAASRYTPRLRHPIMQAVEMVAAINIIASMYSSQDSDDYTEKDKIVMGTLLSALGIAVISSEVYLARRENKQEQVVVDLEKGAREKHGLFESTKENQPAEQVTQTPIPSKRGEV